MNTNDLEINNLIMREIGLEIGPRQRIFDQDTGVEIKINGMDVMAPGCYGGRQSIEFDPHNNKKMMNHLFGYFLEKRAEETDVDVLTYYNVDKENRVECKLSNNETIVSGSYVKDSLKYADIIIQLNGDTPPDLSKYDAQTVTQNQTIKRKTTRSVSNAKNKSNSKAAKNR